MNQAIRMHAQHSHPARHLLKAAITLYYRHPAHHLPGQFCPVTRRMVGHQLPNPLFRGASRPQVTIHEVFRRMGVV